MTKILDLYMRLSAVEVLTYLRERYGYKSLSEMLGLQVSILSRYINGHVLPNTARAERIVKLFNESLLTELVRQRLTRTEDGFYDLSAIVTDVGLLRLIAKVVSTEFSVFSINKLLTVATDGIPLAVQVATELRAGLVIAKKRKDLNIKSYIEEPIKRTPALVEYLYLPRQALRKNEVVLIVDDVARSGETICGMIRIVNRAGAKLAGVFTIVMLEEVKGRISRLLPPSGVLKSLVTFAS
ncbi:MAG: phosphoribosyltransferase family protein [Nitrososphaerota archaeon]|nr:phosphoribosyltransferase family protein [Candidatus Calditenuaceae archaeon]MDW8072804.1 phosphoribosyltransferase family protein [Nitrososphaerota archaeon]